MSKFKEAGTGGNGLFVLHGRKEVYNFPARVACFHIILQIAKGGKVFI
jgi:hypothetical protein